MTNPIDWRPVTIYISAGVRNLEDPKRGYYRCLIVDERTQKTKELKDESTIAGVTPNRMTLTGLITAIQSLKRPCCDITIKPYVALGIEKYSKSGKGINGDLIAELYDSVNMGMHKMNIIRIDKDYALPLLDRR